MWYIYSLRSVFGVSHSEVSGTEGKDYITLSQVLLLALWPITCAIVPHCHLKLFESLYFEQASRTTKEIMANATLANVCKLLVKRSRPMIS